MSGKVNYGELAMKIFLQILRVLFLLLIWNTSGQIGSEIGKSFAGSSNNPNRSIESIVKEMADSVSKGLPQTLNRDLSLIGVYAHGNTINYQLIAVNYVDGTASNELVSGGVKM